MCTVTFIPTKDGFFLTSSRDERSSRKTTPPMSYIHKGIELFFPKDELAGGTWFAVSKKGRVACLLNGAFSYHRKEGNYKKSRGIVLLDSFTYESIAEFVDNTDFKNIEPFTMLTVDYQRDNSIDFNEFRWDGSQKHLTKLDAKLNQIWSSATLYTLDVQKERSTLFKNWITDNSLNEGLSVLNFHNRKHGLLESDDIIMKGEGDLKTLSISQIRLHKSQIDFKYIDLESNSEFSNTLDSNVHEKL